MAAAMKLTERHADELLALANGGDRVPGDETRIIAFMWQGVDAYVLIRRPPLRCRLSVASRRKRLSGLRGGDPNPLGVSRAGVAATLRQERVARRRVRWFERPRLPEIVTLRALPRRRVDRSVFHRRLAVVVLHGREV